MNNRHFIFVYEATVGFDLGTGDSVELTFNALCDQIINLKGENRRDNNKSLQGDFKIPQRLHVGTFWNSPVITSYRGCESCL